MITSLSQVCGPASGGTALTISGTGFEPGAQVTVGGVAATVTSISPSGIQLMTPPGSSGALVDVAVTNPDGGTELQTGAFLYDFADVPGSNPFHDSICHLAHDGITAGCGSGNYCPANSVLRAQMAVFLLRSQHGAAYLPPPAAGIFGDVPTSSTFAPWIEQVYNEGITGGCSTNPLLYCPSNPVSRAAMAVFLLVAQHGTGYVPPACAGIFTDVACPGPFTNWIEQLSNEGSPEAARRIRRCIARAIR